MKLQNGSEEPRDEIRSKDNRYTGARVTFRGSNQLQGGRLVSRRKTN